MTEPVPLQGEIPPTGLTVLVDPPEAKLDIVFVHGFTGHPEKTWKQKRGADQSHDSKRPRFLSHLSSHADRSTSSGSIFWPRDLLPSTVDDARILTYGYDTRIRCGLTPKSNNTVNYISRDFLVALEAERRPNPSRPLTFICHSLGGIVVKEMLRQAFGCFSVRTHLRAIYTSTVGVMFFGTPHGGADPRSFLHHVVQRLANALTIRVDERIFDELLPSSDRLEELRVEFNPMVEKQNWIIHSFQEAEGVLALNGKKVVEDVSSYLNLPNETTEHIGKDHMEMCRFSGFNDPEYKKVSAALQRMVSAAGFVEKNASRADADILPVNEQYRQALLESLAFDEMDSRHDSIKRSHAKTCEWLLQKDEYVEWLDPAKRGEHHGILWIKGKPGAGKSTLMKYALAQTTNSEKGAVILRFFFHARGTQLEKSTFGMYRSLLYQLLRQNPSLLSVFDGPCFNPRISATPRSWSIEVLKELFSLAIQSSPGKRIVCLLDALDECAEAEIRDMVSFLEHVSEVAMESGANVMFCFASRHYPHITARPEWLSLTVEGQEGHDRDICSYLDSELRIGHAPLAEDIRGEVQAKASGVFLWVVLVVQILNKEHDCGRIRALRRRLKDIPTNLHDLFRDILTRDSLHQEELVLCLQWILFAKRPLSPTELYCAVLSGLQTDDPNVLDDLDVSDISDNDIGRFLLDSSKGLAEITKSPTRRVQFIHESVRDYLIQSDGLSKLRNCGDDNFEGISHDVLKRCCATYAQFSISGGEPAGCSGLSSNAMNLNQRSLRSNLWQQQYPFLEYAIRYGLVHADEAQDKGIDQSRFLDEFLIQDWTSLSNCLTKYTTRQYPASSSIFQLFAQLDAAQLFLAHPLGRQFVRAGGDELENAFLRALFSGSCRFIAKVIEVAASNTADPLNPCFQEIYSVFRRKGDIFAPMKGSREKLAPPMQLIKILSINRPELCVFWMLRWHKAAFEGLKPVDLQSSIIRPVSENCQLEMLFFVLDWICGNGGEYGLSECFAQMAILPSNLNESERCYQFAFDVAVGNKVLETAVAIATRYPTVNVNRAVVGQPLLLMVAKKRGEDAVRILLPLVMQRQIASHDVVNSRIPPLDLEVVDANGLSALAVAAKGGLFNLANTLIRAGSQVDTADNLKRTPLHHAALGGHDKVVGSLLAAGANANLRDHRGRTPLYLAVEANSDRVLTILLNTLEQNPSAVGPGAAANTAVDVNAASDEKRLPLHQAVLDQNLSAVRQLLRAKGIDLNPKDEHGRTPFMLSRDVEVMKLLVDSGADIGAKSRCGRSALSYAAQEGALEVVQYLVNDVKVPGVDEGDCDGRTPLSWAVGNAACGKVPHVLVFSGKADINRGDFSGKPPLFYLVDRILLDYSPVRLDRFFWDRDGVDLDVQDSLGRTLLRYILENYRPRRCGYSRHTFPRLIMVLLHSEKVDPTKKDLQGVSALDFALTTARKSLFPNYNFTINHALRLYSEGERNRVKLYRTLGLGEAVVNTLEDFEKWLW